jgi:hypothetical protein
MLSIRNDALNPDETVVFAALFLYCQSDAGNLPAMIEFKYLNGTTEQYEYMWNGSIPYVQWVPTEYHSIRMKLCLETSEDANDGACRVWLDDDVIMDVSGLDTLVSTANQVNIGQSSTFSAYTFFDDVTILANGAPDVSETNTVPIIVLIIIVAIVAVTVIFFALRKSKSFKRL